MNKLAAVLLGSVAGLLSGLLGIGGGLVVGPALMLAGFSPGRAFGTALWVVAPVAFVAVIAGIFTGPGQTSWLLALMVALGGQVGAPVGAAIVQKISSHNLRYIFVIFLIYIALRNFGFVGGDLNHFSDLHLSLRQMLGAALGLGFIAGITSSLFGVGGGVIVVPGLLLVVGGFSFAAAAATSLAAMVPTAIGGALIARTQQRLDFETAIVLIPSSTICAVVAVWLRDQVVAQQSLQLIFASFLLFAAFMLLRQNQRQ